MNASFTSWFKRARSNLIDRYGSTALGLEAILIYFFFYIPIAVMIALSFNDSRYAIVWQGFTIKWWVSLFSGEIIAGVNPTVAWLALQNSLLIAAVTVVVSTTFGTMLALALNRYEFPGKSILQGITYMPIIIPSVVLGISLLIFFSFIGMTTGVETAIIGHIAFDIAYVTIIVLARLQSFDRTLEEAANDLGAQEFETFRWVTLPLIKPGIIAGALLGFAMSFDDYVVTFFIIGNENTLPIFFFGMVRQGISPGVNVIATAIIVSTFIFVGLAQWIGGLTW